MIDLIKIVTFIARIIRLFLYKLYFTLVITQFYFVLLFGMFALLVLASDFFNKWIIKFYFAVLLIDEVLREFSNNFFKSSHYL